MPFASRRTVFFSSSPVSLRLAILMLTGLTVSQSHANAQCPAAGADTTCGTIITITDSGASVAQTGQGPYDGGDDTLVGVINNSRAPVFAIGLTSGTNIFGFDGDGIVSFGIPGNGLDSNGYGGPNAYFTNINPSKTSGIVNFITPIAAKGGMGYFSLENALNTATACSTIINNALKTQASGANICATFTPNLNNTISQAAQLCGFKNFDWIQQITVQFDPSEFYARNVGGAYDSTITGSVRLTSKRAPWSDPPQGGGYAPGFGGDTTPDNSYPFYYDQNTELAGHEDGSAMPACTLATSNGKTLTFHDAPADKCLPGGADTGTAKCQDPVLAPKVTAEPNGSYGGYLTHLAGVNSDGTVTDLGIGFTWTSNYNGSTGNISIKKTNLPADGNGTGGISVTTVQPITNYQYNGVGVTSVNGITIAAFAGPSITNYQAVSQQAAAGRQSYVTFRADLINPGNAFGSVTATLTSLDPYSVRVVPGQGTLNFSPVPANSQVTSSNTFTILTDPTVPLDLTKLQWEFQTTPTPVVANPGRNQTVKVGTIVTLDGSGSMNPSGIGTLTYNWTFTSRPPGTRTALMYLTTPSAQFFADAVGTYVLTLTVSNGVASSSTSVTVSVTP